MSTEGKVVLWVDGCFDMMHYGHANALRQAKQHGDYLIVGVHSDKEILRVKGPPVMEEKERYESVRACKWVDEVVEDAPYTTSLEMIKKYNVSWVIHGDDMALDSDGKDAYEEIKKAGLMKIVKRTVGVSTTDIVNRMLQLSPKSKFFQLKDEEGFNKKFREYLPTARKISSFTTSKEPKSDDKIVYVDGTFDLFHVGHSDFLKEAKKYGDYLIVGLHDNQTILKEKGREPIMSLHERAMGVLSCRHVDDVVIGAPFLLTKENIDSLNISIVIHGSVLDDLQIDPYEVPKKLNMIKQIESPKKYLTTTFIIERILKNYSAYEERNLKKLEKNDAI